MNKNLVLGVIVAIVLVGGVGIYVTGSKKATNEAMMAKDNVDSKMIKDKVISASTTDGAMMAKNKTVGGTTSGDAMMAKNKIVGGTTSGDAMMKSAGTYEAYTSSKIAMATGDHKVVLFFRATWCPTCKTVDADIRAHLDAIPATLTILDVDYDTATDLRKKYGVTKQHTFVEIDAQGNLIKKWSGSLTLSAIVSQVR